MPSTVRYVMSTLCCGVCVALQTSFPGCVCFCCWQCDVGWNRRTWCATPYVFQSFSEFLTATQNISFLCNVCNEYVQATQHQVAFYRIPQPLQKATGLTVKTSQATLAANPSLMIAQVQCDCGASSHCVTVGLCCVTMFLQNLPRSIADFVFVASAANATQTIDIDTASPTGSYWVTVYANSAGSFNLTTQRKSLPVATQSNAVWLSCAIECCMCLHHCKSIVVYGCADVPCGAWSLVGVVFCWHWNTCILLCGVVLCLRWLHGTICGLPSQTQSAVRPNVNCHGKPTSKSHTSGWLM